MYSFRFGKSINIRRLHKGPHMRKYSLLEDMTMLTLFYHMRIPPQPSSHVLQPSNIFLERGERPTNSSKKVSLALNEERESSFDKNTEGRGRGKRVTNLSLISSLPTWFPRKRITRKRITRKHQIKLQKVKCFMIYQQNAVIYLKAYRTMLGKPNHLKFSISRSIHMI